MPGYVSADAVRPWRSLTLVTIAHALNHSQVAIYPLVYLALIEEWGVTVPAIALLTAVDSLVSGGTQLTFSALTRRFSRRTIMGWGNVILGGFMAAQALTSSLIPFAAFGLVSRAGASQQHPLANGLIAEQVPLHRRGISIATHVAGGNLGSVIVPLIGAWLIAGVGWGWTLVLFGVPPALIGISLLFLIRETGEDRRAALLAGSLGDAFRIVLRDRELWLLLGASLLGASARGLGILNVFVPLYLSVVLGVDDTTVALMLTVLLAGSVPAPVVAGWLSDKLGRKRVIAGTYLGGAAGLALLLLVGSDPVGLWIAVALLGAFAFVESPQLQALVADVARPALRDATFSVYFTLAFGVGALWAALFGAITGTLGDADGLPVVFLVMAVSSVAAALLLRPLRVEERIAAVRAEEIRRR